MAKESDEERRVAAIAAYLSSGHRKRSPLSQTQIAAMQLPGLASQSTVSRAFITAKKLGYLLDAVPTLGLEQLTKDGVLDHLERFADMTELRGRVERLGTREGWPRVPTIHCIPVRVNMDAPTEDRRRLIQSFFSQVGLVVHDLVKDCRSIGVSWGETLANTISAIEELVPLHASKGRRIHSVVPLVGEPPAGETSEFSSTLLAERLYRVLGGREVTKKRLSLRYVHSFVSDALAEWHVPADHAEGLRRAFEYYNQVSSYREIFIGTENSSKPDRPHQPALVDSLDAIVTSLSSDRVPWGIATQFGDAAKRGRRSTQPQAAHMLPADRKIMDAVSRVAVGDICGVLLPDGSPGDSEARSKLQERWTGIKQEQLLRQASRATTAKHPGVIVVAFGAKKVMTTLAAMRAGYVNHLIIGEALAHELDRQIVSALRHRQEAEALQSR